jgi:hypothetical protein
MMRRRQRRLEAMRQPQRRRRRARHPAKIGAKAGWQMEDCVYADNADGGWTWAEIAIQAAKNFRAA